MNKYMVLTGSGAHLFYAAKDFDTVLSHVKQMGYTVESILCEGAYSHNKYNELKDYTVINE